MIERSTHFLSTTLSPFTSLYPVILVSIFFHSSSFHVPVQLAKPFPLTTYESIYLLTLGHFSLYKVDDNLKICPLGVFSLVTVLFLRDAYPEKEFGV